MKRVECSTQAEADAAAAAGSAIVWRAGELTARGSAVVDAYGSSVVYAYDSARVDARGSARVYAYGAARVYAYDSARVYAYDSSVVDARGSARVYARGSARVYAYGSSVVYAYDSAFVYAYGSARVTDALTNVELARACPRLIIGPLGSRHATLGVSLPADGSEPVVYTRCWSGRLADFSARVNEVYPTGRYGDEYRATIAYIRAIAAVQQEAA